MKKSILLGLMSLLILNFTSANGAFRKTPVSRTERCSVTLAGMKAIPHQCIRWVDETTKLPFWQGSLGFMLGRLSYLMGLRL